MSLVAGSDIALELKQVRQDGIEFDLAILPIPGVEQAADAPDKPLKIRMKVKVPELAKSFTKDLNLPPERKRKEVDFRRESQKALTGDLPIAVLDPPYDWRRFWPTGRARITHLLPGCIVKWNAPLQRGTEMVLDFSTRFKDGKQVKVSTSLYRVYVEDGAVAVNLPAAAVPDQGLDLRTSETIQGNILAGFNKDHQVFLFLGFREEQPARDWLKELVGDPQEPRIATTAKVTAFNDLFKAARQGGDAERGDLKAVWVNVGLTWEGICKLEPHADQDVLRRRFPAFCDGPRERPGILGDVGDSSPEHWVVGGRHSPDVHAVLTIAADDVDELHGAVTEQLTLAARHGLDVVYQQRGDALPDRARGHEHFGFKDGVSQPGIEGYTRPADGKPNEDAEHPGARIVAADRFVLSGIEEPRLNWMEDGSFQVFRRLAQDVLGWWAQVAGQNRGIPAEYQMTADLLAAKLVGRWPSGTPLALAPTRDYLPVQHPADNLFDYNDDPHGYKTPRFAHIRKLYPRSGAEDEDEHRILRRGIPYGTVFDPAAGGAHAASAERGLLFNAFMADIEQQFEHLQRAWAADLQPHGPDPLVGVGQEPECFRLHRQGADDRRLHLRSYVRTTGAVYAFAPSVPALVALATEDHDKLGIADAGGAPA